MITISSLLPVKKSKHSNNLFSKKNYLNGKKLWTHSSVIGLRNVWQRITVPWKSKFYYKIIRTKFNLHFKSPSKNSCIVFHNISIEIPTENEDYSKCLEQNANSTDEKLNRLEINWKLIELNPLMKLTLVNSICKKYIPFYNIYRLQ